ncbi:MAG: hypothetical protein ACI4R6_00520, partial [Lachnospiraceae bacterium]
RVVKLPSLEKDVPRQMIYLDYSTDGESYTTALEYKALAGRWVGVKNGIFCCHEGEGDGKFAEFGYFCIA